MIEALIYDAIRTPRGKGKRDGSLHGMRPVALVSDLIRALLERNAKVPPALIDDVVLGCVTPIGDQGADIAKTAAMAAGLPDCVAGVQVNRFCASGLEAVNLAAQKVRSGFEDLVIAGGVESMSRVTIGLDGGAWAMDPLTNYETGFVPQGIRSGPHCDHRGILARRRRRLCAAVPAPSCQCTRDGRLRQERRSRPGPKRSCRARARRVHQAPYHHGRPREAAAVLPIDRRQRWVRCCGAPEVPLHRGDQPRAHRREFVRNRGRCSPRPHRIRSLRQGAWPRAPRSHRLDGAIRIRPHHHAPGARSCGTKSADEGTTQEGGHRSLGNRTKRSRPSLSAS